MNGEDIVIEWVAFSTTKGQLKLTVNNLETFEHEVSIVERVACCEVCRKGLSH